MTALSALLRQRLTDCVRTGRPAAEVRDPNVPTRWSQNPDAMSIFHAVMGTAPIEDYAPIVAAWDFSHASVVADLGGGGGSLLRAVLNLNPHLRGMLVDREEGIEAARPRFVGEDPSSRCQLIVADLAESVPAGADVYMLKSVLHGFKDAEAIAMAGTCGGGGFQSHRSSHRTLRRSHARERRNFGS